VTLTLTTTTTTTILLVLLLSFLLYPLQSTYQNFTSPCNLVSVAIHPSSARTFNELDISRERLDMSDTVIHSDVEQNAG
jgi:hypothetical protein